MTNIKDFGERLDINKARRLIALSKGKDGSVSRKTVYKWVTDGKFPKPIQLDGHVSVWNTKECLEKLGLN